MNGIILTLAMLGTPLELHTHAGPEGRYIRACITTDYFVMDERSGIIRYYQHEIRQRLSCQDSLDNFLQIGRHKTKFPPMAMDSQGMVILFVKCELDRHHAEHRHYKERSDHDPSYVAQYGMVSLGSEGQRIPRAKRLKQPWRKMEWTAFKGPGE